MMEIVAMLMATGERISEVLALRWCDIAHLDDDTRRVEVTISATIDDGGVRQPLPKSEHVYRTVTLPEHGRRALLSQRERGLPFDLVFPTRDGTPKRRRNVNTSWRAIRGDDYKWVAPKTFRKTNGTAIERTHGAEAAAAQLGHSGPGITRKHYIDRAIEAGGYTTALDEFNTFTPTKHPPGGHLRIVGGD